MAEGLPILLNQRTETVHNTPKGSLLKALLILLMISPLTLLSAITTTHSPYVGAFCQNDEDHHVHCFLYSAAYNGSMGYEVTGVYHFVDVRTNGREEVAFELQVRSVLIRLILYCRNQKLVMKPPKTDANATNQVDSSYDFCSNPNEIPFVNGQIVTVKGTFIQPSQWDPTLSTPALSFVADLYVIYVISS